ncbi:hypothetical protein Tco_1068614 [Tanacetum coccineum]|uniref:Uncharacterized protein n=1 Tax=Tanacetum coccineum TaxID=301880 RepID=A0ABQ5HG78_9ASTR
MRRPLSSRESGNAFRGQPSKEFLPQIHQELKHRMEEIGVVLLYVVVDVLVYEVYVWWFSCSGFCTRESDVVLKESVRRRNGYIGALKAILRDGDSIENLKFMERMRLEDMEKGTRFLLMMKETNLKIHEKFDFVSLLGDDVIV